MLFLILLVKSVEDDRVALTSLYQAAGGQSWSNKQNWLNGDPCDGVSNYASYWVGAQCTNGRVRYLNFAPPHGITGLTGTLPTQMGLLSNPSDLHIIIQGHPALSGTIPSQFGDLATGGSIRLSLAENSISGTVPSELGGMSQSSGSGFLNVQSNRLIEQANDSLSR